MQSAVLPNSRLLALVDTSELVLNSGQFIPTVDCPILNGQLLSPTVDRCLLVIPALSKPFQQSVPLGSRHLASYLENELIIKNCLNSDLKMANNTLKAELGHRTGIVCRRLPMTKGRRAARRTRYKRTAGRKDLLDRRERWTAHSSTLYMSPPPCDAAPAYSSYCVRADQGPWNPRRTNNPRP